MNIIKKTLVTDQLNNVTPYDEVPYESGAYSQTHPDRLATLGRLFGMAPAPVNRSRVLELGCASGSNLIPMACHMPGSTFVGVDLSARQVASGCRVIRDLALDNISINHANIMDIDESWGLFDYIISHGVYSWVPVDVREKILDISSVNLAPQGIAYVSYNTYPGWHMRETIRHMMLYHVNQFEGYEERIGQARELIDFLAKSVSTDHNPYGMLLQNELSLIRDSKDWYLFHDHLEKNNAPLYFHQFVKQAERHGLQYLGEVDLHTMLTSRFPQEVAETLDRLGRDLINTEQYSDFVCNRFFRQTLLCHNEHVLERNLSGKNINSLLISSALRPQKEPVDLTPGKKQIFMSANGSSFETDYPLTKAALIVLLGHWPGALALDDIYAEALRRLEQSSKANGIFPRPSRLVLADNLLQGYSVNAVELYTWQDEFVTTLSKQPLVSDLVVYQAVENQSVVNQRHESISLDPVTRQMLPFLNGINNQVDIFKELEKSVATGDLTISQNDEPGNDSESIRKIVQKAMDKSLAVLADSRMLIG